MTATVPLTKGLQALVDDEDLELVLAIGPWYADRKGRITYAASGKVGYLHRFLLGAPRGVQVDHANHDGLDNRRINLRFATKGQNQANALKALKKNMSSPFKGVRLARRVLQRPWQAFLIADGVFHYLGYFDSEEGAARAYDEAAREKWGEFTRPNFPLDNSRG